MRHVIISIRHPNERPGRIRSIRLCQMHTIRHLRGHHMSRGPEISAAINQPCASCHLLEQMWKVNNDGPKLNLEGLARTFTLLGYEPARKDSR